MNKLILNLALAALPNELLEDPFFAKLCSYINLDYKICGKIHIHKSFCMTYKELDPSLSNYFTETKSSHQLLSFLFYYPNYVLSMRIKNKEECYSLEMKTVNDEEIKTIKFEKGLEESKITIVTTKLNQALIRNYTINIYYYDKDYNLIKIDEAKKEALEEFSKEFYIPESLAFYFYPNFKKYQIPLNKIKILSEMELDEKTRPKEEKYTFTEPMTFQNIKEALYYYNPKIDKPKAEQLLTKLEEKIGNEPVVISKNLFEDILKYLSGYTGYIIYTKGIILSKKGLEFGYHKILLTNEHISIIKANLNEEQAKVLFYNSKQNEDKESLKEFFGITKSR